MTKLCKDIGLDTHKDTIAVAVADVGHAKPRYYGEVANTPEAVAKLVKKLSPQGEVLSPATRPVPAAMASIVS